MLILFEGMVPPYPDTYITQYGDNADNYAFAGHENYAMVRPLKNINLINHRTVILTRLIAPAS